MSCRRTHAATTRTSLRVGHSLLLTPGWQHNPTRALSRSLHGLLWVQSLEKAFCWVDTTTPWQGFKHLPANPSAPSAVLWPVCLSWPLPLPRGFFYGGKAWQLLLQVLSTTVTSDVGSWWLPQLLSMFPQFRKPELLASACYLVI